jgi:hypothetical protein
MSSSETKDENENQETSLNIFFSKIKLFIKKNIQELLVVFILILSIILLNSTNKTKCYQKGGDNSLPQQPSESSIKTKQIVYQVGQTLRSNQTFQSFLTTLYSILNAVVVFGVLIFTLAVVPALPLFGFMFIIFIILRNKVASFKAL